MPEYRVHVEMVDAFNRKASKDYVLRESTLFADALTDAATVVTNLGNITGCRILRYQVSQVVEYTDTAEEGANRDEGLTLSIRKTDGYRAYLKVPAPLNKTTWFSALDGALVDPIPSPIATYWQMFLGAGIVFISDGEDADTLIGGKLDA